MTKAWKEYRDTITRLYITESRTLEEVKDIMQREHSFKASTRSYRQQFDKWQLGKYNCKKRNVRRLSQQSGIQIEASPTLIGLGSPDDGGGPNSPSHSLASMSPELDHESSYYSPQVSAGISMYQQAHHSSQMPTWEHHQPERAWGQVPAASPMGPGHQQTAGGSPGPSHLDFDDILRQTAQQTGHGAEMHSPHPVHPQSSYSVVLRSGEQPVQQNARIAPEYRYNPYPYQSGARCGFRR
ncbi:hypothetical protein CGCF415_v003198 [Colletotrichum fructicola]|uniref:Clr5 domain-containing protein n=2 Tax=Colletotrichum fructicola (strain Nara gc5) TaxID=1213859 RepID=A0A7J6JR36_COLFN|nr:uncharacterized protein CGMCC3_g7884 [Colletotrichum fructicola]KAF4492840.1 hypothetical protein CGGC5_v002342 [Colletotrichum fructicola Nara gc5]KAE9576131.1 hypothetical protein CGMCC3_g7884 [Colletotrichum fructicola]KAF4426906.1 hypothetical protein CFRS1_v003035 [Colletotrichum fructicola]KAF4895264.1 hypothetical protein CGCFRS4_v006127 [Colletotrichum fructicola]KAF4913199.1 hypothetical protein CGCF415_v003198 [Colletotrichum fructicola]